MTRTWNDESLCGQDFDDGTVAIIIALAETMSNAGESKTSRDDFGSSEMLNQKIKLLVISIASTCALGFSSEVFLSVTGDSQVAKS